LISHKTFKPSCPQPISSLALSGNHDSNHDRTIPRIPSPARCPRLLLGFQPLPGSPSFPGRVRPCARIF
jgi:hypothetical protein